MPDASSVTLASGFSLALAGRTETIASLTLATGTSVNTGTQTGVLTVSSLTVDTVVMGPGTYTSADGFVTGSGSVVVAGATNNYGTWATTNAGGQAADLDYDNDGMSNGVEYFMGETGSTFTPNPTVVTTGTVMTVTWPRDPDAVATFMVQVSDDLSVWTDIVPPDASIDETITTEVTYTVPTGAAKKFCRLVVNP